MRRGIFDGSKHLVVALLVLSLVACAAATPEKHAFQGLVAIETSVKEAMNLAGDAYRAGLISDKDWSEKVAPTYTKYRAADIAASQALVVFAQTHDPATFDTGAVAVLAAEILALVTQLKAGGAK